MRELTRPKVDSLKRLEKLTNIYWDLSRKNFKITGQYPWWNRCKNPWQNTSKTIQQHIKSHHTPWSSGIYSWDASGSTYANQSMWFTILTKVIGIE